MLRYGPEYGAYLQLRIESVTDDSARLLARLAGFAEDSDEMLVFRSLVRVWRDERFLRSRDDPYTSDRPGVVTVDDAPATMNTFLYRFDLAFSLRRLRSVRERIDRFCLLDESTLLSELCGFPELDELAELPVSERELWISDFRGELLSLRKIVIGEQSRLIATGRRVRLRFPLSDTQEQPFSTLDVERGGYERCGGPEDFQGDVEALVAALLTFSDTRSGIPGHAGGGRRLSGTRDSQSGRDFRSVIECFLDASENPIPGTGKDVGGIDTGEGKTPAAAVFLESDRSALESLDRIAEKIGGFLTCMLVESNRSCRKAFGLDNGTETPSAVGLQGGRSFARSVVGNAYRHYGRYDVVLFPVLYGSGYRQVRHIDVSRISPEDATFLVDEKQVRHRKLAGTVLGNFGAFMEKRWRQNDIMWGQLDGAERIIASLVNDPEDRKRFTGEAQAAIVLDTIRPMGVKESRDLLVEAFMRPRNGKPDPDSLSAFVRTLRQYADGRGGAAHDRSLVLGGLDERKLRDHYLRSFDENSCLEPKGAFRNAARAATVTAKMLSGLADRYAVAGRSFFAVLTRVTTFFMWLVEAAISRSLSNLVFHHWLKLLYLFEVVLLLLGYLFVSEPVQQLAVLAFSLTVALHVAVLWLWDRLRSRNLVSGILKVFLIVMVVVLMVAGMACIANLAGFVEWAPMFERLRGWFAARC